MRLVRTLAALAALPAAALPAHATTFSAGEFVTWSQVAWGDDPACNPMGSNISALLEMNFNSLFAPSGLLQVGFPGIAGFSLIFGSPDAVITYLPADGPPGALTADLLDPVTSASGFFGGQVVAATLNVAFSDTGLLAHPSGVTFGDLVFQNLASFGAAEGDPDVGPELAELDGSSVREVLSEVNFVLGGATSPFTPDDLSALLDFAARAFNGGNLEWNADTFLAFPSSTMSTVPGPPKWAILLIGLAGSATSRRRQKLSTRAASV
jgi:hypothetical protein